MKHLPRSVDALRRDLRFMEGHLHLQTLRERGTLDYHTPLWQRMVMNQTYPLRVNHTRPLRNHYPSFPDLVLVPLHR